MRDQDRARAVVLGLLDVYEPSRVRTAWIAYSVSRALGVEVTTSEVGRWSRAAGHLLADGRGRPRRLSDAEARALLDLHERHGQTYCDLEARFDLPQGVLSAALRRARDARAARLVSGPRQLSFSFWRRSGAS